MTEEAQTKQPDEMYCSSCGALVKKDAQFCPQCGTPSGGTGAVSPTVGRGAGPAVAASLPLVEADIRRRVDTDRQMSFGAYILWIIVLTVFTLGIGTIIYGYIIEYQLVDRRNQHFARQHALLYNVLRVLRERADASNDAKALAHVDRAEGMLNDAAMREGERNAWLWGVILPLVTLGIAGLYTLWFLTVDYRRHSVRQREIWDTISECFRASTGKSIAVVDESVLPDRNFWIYLLLTILTLGLFGIYWMYVLFSDPNNHFARQAFAEDQTVSYLRALA